MAILEVGRLGGRVLSRAPGFRIDFVRDWKPAASRWAGGGHRTAFQHHHWLEAWYGAFAEASPLIAIITDTATDQQVALLPLIRRVSNGIRIVEFTDLGVTDYNAPVLGFAAPHDHIEGRALCQALLAGLRNLPDGVDLLRLRKMPANVGGMPNPLASLGRMGSCSLNGNLVVVGDDFAAYRASLKRMELPRSWRVFNRYPGAKFRIVTNIDEALALLDTMDVQQQDRMKQLGLKFVLNDDRHARFYRDIVKRGVSEGYAIVSALTCDEEVVATTLGIRRGSDYTLLRISNAGKRWSSCSPGLLVIERTMAALHQDGVRQFDLSIGNYAYKRRFGAAQLPLADVSIALGWRGLPYVLRDYAAQRSRRYPRLHEWIHRALGRPPSGEEK
jgi:CelD/BcsL family acetyltransferase involved in cellulose biosynthesis